MLVPAPAQTPATDRVPTSEVAPMPAPDEPVAEVAGDPIQDAALDHVAPGLGSAIEAAGEIAEALAAPDPATPTAATAAGLPARRKWRRRITPEQDRDD